MELNDGPAALIPLPSTGQQQQQQQQQPPLPLKHCLARLSGSIASGPLPSSAIPAPSVEILGRFSRDSSRILWRYFQDYLKDSFESYLGIPNLQDFLEDSREVLGRFSGDSYEILWRFFQDSLEMFSGFV